MLEEILKNISKLYFPSQISELDEIDRYNNSIEHQNLCRVLTTFENKHRNERSYDDIIEDFKCINKKMVFHDVTNFNACDRSFNFQLTKLDGNNLHSICLNISIIIPYFTIYLLDTVVDESRTRWVEKPVENKFLESLYPDEIAKISELVEKSCKINKFPSELLKCKLPEINRGFIKFGDFTFFNAFFLDEYYTRL